MAVIAWKLKYYIYKQSVPIATKVLSFILAHGEGVLNTILRAKFISDLEAIVAVIIW